MKRIIILLLVCFISALLIQYYYIINGNLYEYFCENTIQDGVNKAILALENTFGAIDFSAGVETAGSVYNNNANILASYNDVNADQVDWMNSLIKQKHKYAHLHYNTDSRRPPSDIAMFPLIMIDIDVYNYVDGGATPENYTIIENLTDNQKDYFTDPADWTNSNGVSFASNFGAYFNSYGQPIIRIHSDGNDYYYVRKPLNKWCNISYLAKTTSTDEATLRSAAGSGQELNGAGQIYIEAWVYYDCIANEDWPEISGSPYESINYKGSFMNSPLGAAPEVDDGQFIGLLRSRWSVNENGYRHRLEEKRTERKEAKDWMVGSNNFVSHLVAGGKPNGLAEVKADECVRAARSYFRSIGRSKRFRKQKDNIGEWCTNQIGISDSNWFGKRVGAVSNDNNHALGPEFPNKYLYSNSYSDKFGGRGEGNGQDQQWWRNEYDTKYVGGALNREIEDNRTISSGTDLYLDSNVLGNYNTVVDDLMINSNFTSGIKGERALSADVGNAKCVTVSPNNSKVKYTTTDCPTNSGTETCTHVSNPRTDDTPTPCTYMFEIDRPTDLETKCNRYLSDGSLTHIEAMSKRMIGTTGGDTPYNPSKLYSDL